MRAESGAMGMERVNRIWRHRTYQECLEKIRAHEETREFCRHTPEHFLDVARLTYMLALEEGILPEEEIPREGQCRNCGKNPFGLRIFGRRAGDGSSSDTQPQDGSGGNRAVGSVLPGGQAVSELLFLSGSGKMRLAGDKKESGD